MSAPGGGYPNQNALPQQGHQMMYGAQGQNQPMQGQMRANYPQSMMMSHMGMQGSYGATGMPQPMIQQTPQQLQYGMMGGPHNQMMSGQMMMHPQHLQNMGGSMQPGMGMNQDYQMGQPASQPSSNMTSGMGSQGSHGMTASGYSMSTNSYSNLNQGMQAMGQPMSMSQSMQQPQPMHQMQQPQSQQIHPQHQMQQPLSQQIQQPGSQQMSHMQQPLSNQGMPQPMSNQNIQQPLSQQPLSQQPLSQQTAQQAQSKSPMVPAMTQQHTPQSIQQMTPQMIQPPSIPGASCGPLSVGPATQAPMSQGGPLSVNPATPGPQSHEPPKLIASHPGIQPQKQSFIHSRALDESARNKQPIIQDCVLAAKRLIQYDLRATYFEWSRKIGDAIKSDNENFEEVRRVRDDLLAVCDLIESNMATFMEAHKQMGKLDKVFEKEKIAPSGEISTQLSIISNFNASTQQSMDNFHRTIGNVCGLLKQMRKRQQIDSSMISNKRKRAEFMDDDQL